MATEADVVIKIRALMDSPFFFGSLCILIVSDMYYERPDEIETRSPRSHIGFSELQFILGLAISKPIHLHFGSKEQTDRQITELRMLLDEYHKVLSLMWLPKEPHDGSVEASKIDHLSHLEDPGSAWREPIHYAAGASYEFQYLQMAGSRYENDRQWMITNIGTDIKMLCHLVEYIKNRQAKYLSSALDVKDKWNQYYKNIQDAFTIDLSALPFSEAIKLAFSQNFSCEPGMVNCEYSRMGDRNEFLARPALKLSPDSYFIPDLFALAQTIYETPFVWMYKDVQYRGQATQNRGAWLEDAAARYLSHVFQQSHVLRSVDIYATPSRKISEIDVLIIHKESVIIVQCKSKRLTALARGGNAAQLTEDFQKAIQSSYDQGRKCLEAILSGNFLKAARGGIKVDLPKSCRSGWIMCVVADDYPALSFKTNHFLFRENESSPFPICITIFDLDIMKDLLKTEANFIYYLQQRQRYASRIIADQEQAVLAYHLKRKLYFEGEDAPDLIHIDSGWGESVHRYLAETRVLGIPPEQTDLGKVPWWRPEFNRLVAACSKVEGQLALEASKFLLSISPNGCEVLVNIVAQLRSRCRQGEPSSDASVLFDKRGVSYIVFGRNEEDWHERAFVHATLAKYKRKADFWVGFGELALPQGSSMCVIVLSESWHADPTIEELASHLRPGHAISARRGRIKLPSLKIGRNERCPCGSGIKYKKCHGRTLS